MKTPIEKLFSLIALGIPQTVLAKYCHCHQSVISKIIRGEYKITEKMIFLIDEGIKNFYKDITEKIKENE